MTRRGRLTAVTFVLLGALAFGPVPSAHADDCDDMPGLSDDWCHGDGETPEPDGTPEPTAAATPRPATPAPTAARTATPTSRPAPPVTARTPTPSVIDNVEVPTPDPEATPEIIVEGPIAEQPLDVAEPTASASSWIFGFIVGLVIGGFIGRASWGIRRRKRQQIFG